MSSAVQFYGSNAVVKAFEYKKISNWAIFQGRALLHKCVEESIDESSASLLEFLEMISDGGTVATYTLKVYEGKNPTIKENTPCDGSFNFKLVSEEVRQERALTFSRNDKVILERLEAIEKRFDEPAEEGEEDEPEPASIQGVLMGYLKEPAKITELIGTIGTVMALFKPKQVGALAGAPQIPDMENDKLSQALAILQQHDPKIADHLMKLAGIAVNNPAAFKILLQTLEAQ